MRELHLKLGSFGADGLTIGRHVSSLLLVRESPSALVGGVECERRLDLMEPKEINDGLLSSREDLAVFSPEIECDDMMEIQEFLLKAEGIF